MKIKLGKHIFTSLSYYSDMDKFSDLYNRGFGPVEARSFLGFKYVLWRIRTINTSRTRRYA